MVAFARVMVLIKLRAVEFCEAEVIGRKVSWHPIQQHIQTGIVRCGNELAELIARSKTTRWRVQTERLITPAAVKRMFTDRQQFQMGKAHFHRVRDQLLFQLFVAQPEVVISMAAPGSKMHFVNGDRFIKAVGLLTRLGHLHFFRQTADHGGGLRTHLCFKRIRIGFQPELAVRINNFVFVELAIHCAGNKQFPHAVFAAKAHRMTAAIPKVELTDHGNALRIRRPQDKPRSGHAINHGAVRAHGFIRAQVRAFRQQPGLHILQERPKTVGIVDQVLLVMPGDSQLIAERIFTARDDGAKEPARIDTGKLGTFTPGFRLNYPHF